MELPFDLENVMVGDIHMSEACRNKHVERLSVHFYWLSGKESLLS